MALYDDPRILRAIAHPTRNRILHELGASGSLRATDLAAHLDIPANQASFHLRQLAKYGLIEEDPEHPGDRRSRAWRVVDDSVTFSTRAMAAQPGGEAAVAVFRRSAEARAHQLVEAIYAETEAPLHGDEAAAPRSITEYTMLLDAPAAEALNAELAEVLHRHLVAGRERASDPQVRSWSFFSMLQPVPESNASRDAEPLDTLTP